MKENNVDIDAAVDLKQEPTEETEERTEETAAVPPEEAPDVGADEADAVCKEIDALHKKIEELERTNEEYLQSYRRLRADFDNYKRRTRQEMLQAADNGKEELLLQLLPVLDNLERALTATGEPDKWRSGVEMIFRQFLEILLAAGLKPIPAVGEMFDPNLHEALLREPSEQPENTILEEIKKGYLFG
ncbi:MAG: nucleotide exchange factor GrpE, partial [Firmicutes bacterium]|nr:nucleotide exchange factor GrpE [Bacillota bacterium]